MNGVAKGARLSSALQEQVHAAVDRRAFLRNSGLAIGGLAAVSAAGGSRVQRAEAAAPTAGGAAAVTGESQAQTPEGKPKPALYRETEHIRRYYELAR